MSKELDCRDCCYEYQWMRAKHYLDFLFMLRDNTHDIFERKNYDRILPLKTRYDAGERSDELYSAIVNSI